MGLIKGDTFNKYFTVFLLTTINLLNYMDRFTIAGVLTLLQDPKKSGWPKEIDDTLGGLLQTAFIVSYMLFSPVFGYLGDRYQRKYIITFGVLLWSAFTLVGSFSMNFWMLFGTRLFVGIGEASYATLAPTMIADLFPTEKRLRMLSIFYIAMPVGMALGYMVGSQVSAVVHHFYPYTASWKWAFRITPGLGVVVALLACFVLREPVRGLADGQRSAKGVRGKVGIGAYLSDIWYLLKNRTFVLSTLGFTAVTYTTGALAQWAPTFIERVSLMVDPEHGYGNGKASILFGVVTVLGGIFGTVVGSELSKFLNRFTRKAEAMVCAISLIGATPMLFVSLLVVQYKVIYVTWATVFLTIFFACLNWTPVSAMLLYTVIPSRRATASAFQILCSHALGDAASPTVVGAISDAIFKYIGPYQGLEKGKAISMEYGLFTTVIIMLLGGGAFLYATLTVEDDRKAVEHYTQKRNAQVQKRGDVDTSSSGSTEYTRGGEKEQLLPDPNTIVKI